VLLKSVLIKLVTCLQEGYNPIINGMNTDLARLLSTVLSILVATIYTLTYGIIMVKIWSTWKTHASQEKCRCCIKTNKHLISKQCIFSRWRCEKACSRATSAPRCIHCVLCWMAIHSLFTLYQHHWHYIRCTECWTTLSHTYGSLCTVYGCTTVHIVCHVTHCAQIVC
jgi:hypothetical protein